MIPTYTAHEVVNLTHEEALNLPEIHEILFPDGRRLVTSFEETYYTYTFWEIFRAYSKTEIKLEHHVSSVLKNKPLNANTHTTLCSRILKSVVEEEGLFYPIQKEPLLKMIYEQISTAMSRCSLVSEECVTSIDILDFIQITKHPEIQALRDEAIADPQNKIQYAYAKTIELIESLPEFDENGLAIAVRSKMVKNNQVNQCVMLRGFPTEVDGAIFPTAVFSNYTLGNTSLYDFVSDSRTAAKSHFYSDTALKDSEYMARKFQLFTTTVESIVYEDCGSTQHETWVVRGPEYDKTGTPTYNGDLPMLIGKYYLEEGFPGYKVIDGSETHLYGKTISFRSVLHCKASNPHTVCHICAGKLSENISRFANIGHLGGVSSTKDLTQSILSIKHVNTSSLGVKVLLKDHERKYMNTGKDGAGFYLNLKLKELNPKLLINSEEAQGLVDLSINEGIENITLTRISALRLVGLSTYIGGRESVVTLEVEQKSKPSLISREFLHYIKETGYETDSNGNFVIDMSKWDYDEPLFVMPNKEESFVDLSAAVDILVRSSQKQLKKRIVQNAASSLLHEFFDLINSKLSINILALEIIVYALMVESKTSYALARHGSEPVLGTGQLLTIHRSLGPALAYQEQHDTLSDPISFFKGTRPDNPMDVFLAPKEVVAHYGPGR